MPFVEIEKPLKDFISIKSDGLVTISASLIRRRFIKGTLMAQRNLKVKVFYDKENRQIGLKPDEKGYKIFKSGGAYYIKCRPLARIVVGRFPPKWSNKHKMLVFSYA